MFENVLKKKKNENGIWPIKKGQQKCYMPDKCNVLIFGSTSKPRYVVQRK